MSARSEELQRILRAVATDLERDGYAATQVAAAMTVIGISRIFSEEKEQALRMLEAARKVVARQEDEEWVQ